MQARHATSFRAFSGAVSLLALLLLTAAPGALAAQDAEDEAFFEDDASDGVQIEWGLEAKVHYRDSEEFRFPLRFPFGPNQIPPGQDNVFLATVDPDGHFEFSNLSLTATATWSENLEAHAKIDFFDLYDRNPTSGDREIDVDEVWIRFGREPEPAVLPPGSGAYLKVGKMPKFERQNDRHLESYGLVSTAFNRFEDLGLELGIDLGRHVYLRASVTRGNPVFIRDPNALAGDNGTDEIDGRFDNPDPRLGSGVVILYDAEVEDFDGGEDPEIGVGLGFRFADEAGEDGVDFMLFGYERDLADTVDFRGSFYGGDLDLLRGPLDLPMFGLPVQGDSKEEFGANLWVYLGGFTFFGQYVDQEVAGLERSGFEAEAAWRLDLPLRWGVGGQQLFPSLQPALRYSRLEPDFPGNPLFPAPSVTWDWTKIDYGLRLGILAGDSSTIDLTLEFADNEFTLASGRDVSQDELLMTLRWQL